ncbi:uncharacterized protein LOC128679291 [Plodia interpunctella]|uniref:uncharacterized protein LOC128679291 n=1 Tax=Plodia interpunctella TaxID=58824 RepID=UPI0023688567|nr:uncharacterized protein LOC128679291 [Plodia interpunctella]
MGKNKTIPSGERTIILRVLHFFEEEKKKGSPLLPLKKALSRTSTATGVSLSTITRIKKEELKILKEMSLSAAPEVTPTETSTLVPKPRPTVVLPTPGKKRRPAYNKLEIDEFTISSIKKIVNDFHKEKKELPTLKKILAVAKADFNFPGQKETLRKILREKCGFMFTKCMKKKNLLRGGNEIGFWRARNTKGKQKKQLNKKKVKNEEKASCCGIDNELNEDEIQNNISDKQHDISELKIEMHKINNALDETDKVQNEFCSMKNEQNLTNRSSFDWFSSTNEALLND